MEIRNLDIKTMLERTLGNLSSKLIIVTFTDIEMAVCKYFTTSLNTDTFFKKPNRILHNLHWAIPLIFTVTLQSGYQMSVWRS